MPTPVEQTRETNQPTTLNAYKTLFAGGEHGARSGLAIRNLPTSAVPLLVRISPKAATAPTWADGAEDFVIYPGDTYPFNANATTRIQVIGQGGAVVNYSAWETV